MKKIVIQSAAKNLLLISFILLTSCRTVKKEWVKETFAEKSELTQFAQETQKTQETLKTEISEKVSQIETLVSKNETSSTSEVTNENTTVSGTIEAEEGKEKSITIGNTTIKSNGANVSFSTSSNKTATKQFERQLQEITLQLEYERTLNKSLQSEVNSLKSENVFIKSEIEKLKTSQSKQTTKRNFTLTTWLIILGVLVGSYFVYRFRKRIF